MNIYTKMLEVFMENGVVLNKDQMKYLQKFSESIRDNQKYGNKKKNKKKRK